MKLRFLPAFLVVLVGCSHDQAFSGFTDLDSWSAEPDLVIGDPADPLYVFHEPDALRITGAAEVVTLHRQERRLRLFDASGRFVHDVAGPDDLDGPVRLELRGDTAWVLDQLRRTEFRRFWLSDGAPLGAHPAGEVGDFGSVSMPQTRVRVIGLLADGSYLATPAGVARDWVAGTHTSMALLRVTADGLILDSLAVLARDRSMIGFRQRDGQVGVYSTQPFSDDPLFAVSFSADRLYILDRRVEGQSEREGTPHFRLTVRSLDGADQAEHTFAYRPRPMSRTWADQVVRSWQAELGMAYSHSGPLIREQLYIPVHQPPVAEMHVAADGRVWLREWDVMQAHRDYAVTGGAPPHASWLVVSPEGELEGRVELPLDLRWLYADGDVLWGSYTDPARGAKIVRYRVGGPVT